MTISTTANRASYVGNGVTTVFPFAPPFVANTDLVVTETIGAGTPTVLVLNTDYTVTGAGSASGGTVTRLVATANGTVLLIVRAVPFTQSSQWPNGTAFDGPTVEAAFDKAVMLIDQVSDRLDVAVLGTITATAQSIANVPAGNIAAINVQTALNELDTEKLALAGGTMGGALVLAADPKAALQAAALRNLTKAIFGFTYANNAGDAVNDLDIAAGGAADSTGAYWITGAALTKQSDAVWAPGNAAGGLDLIGSAGNNDFHIWAIARSDTGVVDYLYSLSSTAPTMPTNYNFKRLIGFFIRRAGTIVALHTYETEGGGLHLSWDVPTADISLTNTLTTAARTDPLKVPLAFSVVALIMVQMADSVAGFAIADITCPDVSDITVGAGGNPIRCFSTATASFTAVEVRTSSTGTVRSKADTATIDTYVVYTNGFKWARRN